MGYFSVLRGKAYDRVSPYYTDQNKAWSSKEYIKWQEHILQKMLVKNLKEGNNGREMKFVRNGDDGLSVTLSAPLSTSALLGMNFWIAALCLLVFSAQKYLCYRDGIPISSLSAHAHRYVCMCAKSLQSCPNLCNLWTGACQAPVHRILQARILGWVATSSFRVYVCIFACLRTYTTLHKTIHIEESWLKWLS